MFETKEIHKSNFSTFEICQNQIIGITKDYHFKIISLRPFEEIFSVPESYGFEIYDDKCLVGKKDNRQMILLSIPERKIIKEFDYDINLKGILVNEFLYTNKYWKEKSSIIEFSFEKNDINRVFETTTGINSYLDQDSYLTITNSHTIS